MNKKKHHQGAGSRPSRILILAVAMLLAGAAVWVFWHIGAGDDAAPIAEGEELTAPAPAYLPPPPESALPTRYMAIVIDDIGYDLDAVKDLLALEIPLTFGILPHCPYSVDSARKAHGAGQEVILHLPMEPDEYPARDPGEGALLVTMTGEELRHQLTANLLAVPHISGVNNHMGSRFMEDEGKLVLLFSELHKRGLFFLDSLTKHTSRGRETAEATGVDFLERDVFLDNSRNVHDTLEVLMNLIQNADRWNRLIVIGHPYDSTVAALQKALPAFDEHNITMVPLSHMVEQ